MKTRFNPINENIKEPEVRVIDAEGQNLGVMATPEAIKVAREKGLDLVLVTLAAQPPIAKIASFRDFLKKTRGVAVKDALREEDLKTLRLGPNTDDNDLALRIARAKEYLAKGKFVRFELMFKGRMISHPEVGESKLTLVKNGLAAEAKVQQDIERKGRLMTVVFGPKENSGKQENKS